MRLFAKVPEELYQHYLSLLQTFVAYKDDVTVQNNIDKCIPGNVFV